ncbi:MAG: ATP-binding cassette domain-containing protein [Gammaproteobacteria bacterium]
MRAYPALTPATKRAVCESRSLHNPDRLSPIGKNASADQRPSALAPESAGQVDADPNESQEKNVDGSVEQGPLGFHAREIRKSFGSRVVLDGLTLEVPNGCALGLLGANGSGKTTLLKILLGQVRADSGGAYAADEPSHQLSADARERIGYVPQSPAQFSWLDGKAAQENTMVVRSFPHGGFTRKTLP